MFYRAAEQVGMSANDRICSSRRMTTLTATTVTGGGTCSAVQDHPLVIRRESQRKVAGLVLQGSFLKPGVVVKVYQRCFLELVKASTSVAD